METGIDRVRLHVKEREKNPVMSNKVSFTKLSLVLLVSLSFVCAFLDSADAEKSEEERIAELNRKIQERGGPLDSWKDISFRAL